MADTERQPWDRLPEETSKAYQAFTIYCSMPPNNRSIVKALEKAAKKPSNRGHWIRWSGHYSWVKRALAHDEFAEKERLAAADTARREMYERQARAGSFMAGIGVQALQGLQTAPPTKTDDIVKLVVEGAKLERLARGEPGDTTEVRGQMTFIDELRNELKGAAQDTGGDPDAEAGAGESAVELGAAQDSEDLAPEQLAD
jgi:hypothetical protein